MVHLEFDQAALREAARIEVLQKYEILDTPPDGRYDRITKLTTKLLHVPIAVIALVDSRRIWFKSKVGIDLQEIGREPGLCASAIHSDELYQVEDARNDPRTLNNPLVSGDFGLQFYCAVPLKTTEGYYLGTLCVIDKKPRSLNEWEKEVLRDLASLVMDQMELQLQAKTTMKHHHQILNTTAHDLKNPVSIMPLLADLIMENKENPAAIDDISKQIKDAGRRMSITINNLLENAIEGDGRSHLRLEEINLKELVKGVVSANNALAKKKDQILNFSELESCNVFADHRRLTEVIDNLISNAIKFSRPFQIIEVSLKTREGKAILDVMDEGLGLTKDDQKNLFRKFTSLSARPTGGEVSTGLGLFIAKEIIAAHHGDIYANSEGKDKGSCFTIELPLSEED